MSALARFFNHYKKEVIGYDKTKTKLTTQLENEGIICHFNEDVASLNLLLKNSFSYIYYFATLKFQVNIKSN